MTSTDSSAKPLASAFDSPYFGKDISFQIDQPVGSMSISPCGRDVVLASKEGLHIIDLDSPYLPPRYLPYRMPWEVADVQWSPFALRETWIVSTSNQKALVWNVGAKSWQDSIEFVLHGHSRAITDINFSAYHPDILATCAVDSFVHCWDLRAPSRPAISFSDWFAGATQVKWNRQNSHIIASAHDKYLRIWDDRMGAYPIRSIEAHTTKIYGLDWNRHVESYIVTCSLDKTIKFWDINNLDDVPTRVINTGFPVWRARHTPFGWSLLAMPQRGNSDLHLYDRRPQVEGETRWNDTPVTTFQGHTGKVREFLWRSRGSIENSVDNREFQLVTWGTDRQLKLHRVEPETMVAVGYEKGVSTVPKLNLTRKGASYKTFRNEPMEDVVEMFGSQQGSSPAPGSQFRSKVRGVDTVGMRKFTVPLNRGWTQGQTMNNRVSMNGRSAIRQDMNPIAWMKNVKVSSEDQEALSDEITQVGDRFTKVSFEAVDVQQRRATIALHGPWGEDNMPIFLKIDVKFPKDYPRGASPVCSIQKTASMTDVLSKRLSTDIKTIAEAYVKNQRGCIEAMLRYLLREQDVEELVSTVEQEDPDPEKLSGSALLDELSSDEDDEDVGAFQGQGGLTSSELLNQNYMVPVAKACGAIWAENGHLVCFFPPKPKEPPSFLDALAGADGEKSRAEKVFEGFGRLHTASPGPRATIGTATTNDEAASEFSDDSMSSSSSGSSSSTGARAVQLLPLNGWRSASRHIRSAEDSQRSTNGLSASKGTISLAKNIMSIHDFSDLIASKRELAQEYQLYGNGASVCAHNALVATKHNNLPLARIWHLIKLVISDEVPYETVHEAKASGNINLIAESAWSKLNRKDSGVDLGDHTQDKTAKDTRKARVRWGGHSFGSHWLVPKLFDYFEALADVQMLAMLSCILHEPGAASEPSKPLHDDSEIATMGLRSPAFSVDYFPSREVAQSLFGHHPAALSRLMHVASSRGTGAGTNTSFGSSGDQTGQNSLMPPSMGSTPPSIHSPASDHPRRGSRMSLDGRDRNVYATQVSSLSTSPEGFRFSRRVNSTLALTNPRAALQNLAQGHSNSPPSGALDLGKKPSPSANYISHATTAISTASGWGSPMFPGTLRGKHAPGGSNLTEGPSGYAQSVDVDVDGKARPHFPNAMLATQKPSPTKSTNSMTKVVGGKSSRRRVKISLALQNQTVFDNDGYVSLPLLDPNQDFKFRAYRAQYAELLDVWGLHVQKCEVLKVDDLLPYFGTSTRSFRGSDASDVTTSQDQNLPRTLLKHETSASSLSLAQRKRNLTTSTKPAEPTGLFLQHHCIRCGEALSPVQKNGLTVGWHCLSCPSNPKPMKQIFCSICDEIINGIMIPCLECGHVSCFSCGEEWFGVIGREDNGQGQVCPTGCGCICSQHQTVRVPWPSGVVDDSLSDAGTEFLSTAPSATTSSLITVTDNQAESAIDDREDGWGGSEDEMLTDNAIWGSSNLAAIGRVGSVSSRGLKNQTSRETIRRA